MSIVITTTTEETFSRFFFYISYKNSVLLLSCGVAGSPATHQCCEQVYIDTEDIIFQVTCQGQVIAGVVAKTKKQAKYAARQVKVTYEELTPIITIQVSTENNKKCTSKY